VKTTRGTAVVGPGRVDVDAGQRVTDQPGLVLALVGEQRPAVGVADDVEPVVARDAQVVVDLEEAAAAGLDADRVQPEVVGRGAPADGDEQLVAGQLPPVRQGDGDRSVGAVTGDRSAGRRARS
jgi:hypothetical protein